MSATRQAIRLAGPDELVDIVQSHPLPTDWPPPDCHVEYTGPIASNVFWSGSALLFDVVSDAGDLPAAGFWWTTLGNVVLGSFTDNPETQAAISFVVNQIASSWTGAASAYPVVFQRNEGKTMKWIRNTYRGDLGGGVEQFQFKIDLGRPGDDPDLDEVQCLALATQLAGIFLAKNATWFANLAADVKFTEVGCVMMEATSATAADGSGGNAAQRFATQWHPYIVGLEPAGTQATSLPYEVALAISLQTDHRGPSGRGRFYLPPLAVQSMAAGGLFSNGTITNILNGIVPWIEEINSATAWDVLVVSPRRLILNNVTSVNAGHVPDSQRRRRRSQDEAREVRVLV